MSQVQTKEVQAGVQEELPSGESRYVNFQGSNISCFMVRQGLTFSSVSQGSYASKYSPTPRLHGFQRSSASVAVSASR